MNDIWWQTVGEGKCHLVLLHGWGLNAGVWDCITPQLASHFTLHVVDLNNNQLPSMPVLVHYTRLQTNYTVKDSTDATGTIVIPVTAGTY